MLHISVSHISCLYLVKETAEIDRESEQACVHACLCILSQYVVLVHAHGFACTYTDKTVRLQLGVCASKACSLSCMERCVSVHMNACVIVRVSSCALLSTQLLSAACLLGSAVTWPLLRSTRGSGGAEENYHISSQCQDFLNFSTCM